MNIKAKYHKGKIAFQSPIFLPDEEIDVTVTVPDTAVKKNKTSGSS